MYHSEDFQKLISSLDRYIGNHTFDYLQKFFEKKTVPYDSLEGDSLELGYWGFYDCLSSLFSNTNTKLLLTKKAQVIKNKSGYNHSAFDNLQKRYVNVAEKYTLPSSNHSDENSKLNCFILYDSNDLNKFILDSINAN